MNNILFITPYFKPANNGGGGQISVENLVEALKKKNNISVISYNHDFNSKFELSNSYYTNTSCIKRYFFSVKNLFLIIRDLNNIKFDFIYFNSFFSPICIFFQFYFYFNKTTKILSTKGEFYDGALNEKKIKKRIWIHVFKMLFSPKLIHITSLHEKFSIKNHFPFAKIIFARDIPNSIPDLIYNDNLDFSNKFKIIFLSRINPKKNLTFIPKILKHTKCNIVIDIYGDVGDSDYYLDALNKFKNLPNNITWNFKGALGFNHSKIIFHKYDLFMFPTLGENFGYVIYESLSCGCPVLLSKDTTPWNDLINFGVGFNVDLENTKKWIEKIEYYNKLTNSERKETFSKCRSYILSKFDKNIIIKENLELFK